MDSATEARFWSKVDKSGECWEWTASLKPNGYGQFAINRKPRYAHRLAYELTHGPIPAGMQVDHQCHNRTCVRPRHLQAVTHKENQENRAKAGRGVYFDKRRGTWSASVMHNRKPYWVGSFSTRSEAEAATAAKRNELFTNNLTDRKAA